MKEYKGQCAIAGKKYDCEVRNGVRYINNMTVDNFIKTLSFEEVLQAAVVGKAVIEDIATTRIMKAKRKIHEKRSPQRMFNELHQAKNN